MPSLFKDVPESVVDANLMLHLLHNEDDFPQKIDSSIGVYRTDECKCVDIKCLHRRFLKNLKLKPLETTKLISSSRQTLRAVGR